MQLRDRRVWVVGASSGIGAELALLLAQEGTRLAISARSVEGLETIARRAGGGVLVQALDVAETGALERAARELREAWGGIDVLLYCAGNWRPTIVTEFDADEFEQQVAVNFVGLVRAVGAVLPDMLEGRAGEIVAIASIAGYQGLPTAAGYCSTKAAMITFLESLRVDLKPLGVGVTTINPGFVDTPLMQQNSFPMPFIMPADEAARRIVRGLRRGDAEIAFPKRAALPLKLLSAAPRPVYDLVASRLRGLANR